MANIESIELSRVITALQRLKSNISIATLYDKQMEQVKKYLKNDTTGLVNSILDFMVNAGSVSMTIETKNDSLDNYLTIWQKAILNKDINVGVPRGLRELSGEYFKERWTSSFIALQILWDDVKIGNETWTMPTDMWFANGASITVDGKETTLNDRKYYLDKSKKKELTNSANKSVIIRKPYNTWYDVYPTPFLVKRGVLFNALLKDAILSKQADVIEQIIPYLLLLQSGTDKLAEIGALASETDLKTLKTTIIEAVQEHDLTGEFGKLIAALSYDTKLEHFIPDLKKLLDADITKGCDKNILAGMGMIELIGFSKNREEAVINPKMLVEEVKDAVCDWALILEEVVYQIIEKNKSKYRTSDVTTIKVVPGQIKTFLTDAFKTLVASLYNKGLIPYENIIQDIAGYEFEGTLERKRKENSEKLAEVFTPPLIQNVDNGLNDYGKDKQLPTTGPDNAPDNKNKKVNKEKQKAEEIEEVDEELENILAEIVEFKAPYQNIDELPPAVKNHLPVGAKIIFVKVVNEALKRGLSDGDAFKEAWHVVKQTYFKDTDGKWKKKKK